jgi:hypothetical protein
MAYTYGDTVDANCDFEVYLIDRDSFAGLRLTQLLHPFAGMMQRRTFMTGTTFILAVLAVLTALLVFKVRVAVAGGKYLLMLGLIVAVVWMIGRAMRR